MALMAPSDDAKRIIEAFGIKNYNNLVKVTITFEVNEAVKIETISLAHKPDENALIETLKIYELVEKK